MWLERFLLAIDTSPVGSAIEKRRQLLTYGDEPGRIYVENVRAFFGMSHRVALALCDLAVRQGLFDKFTAVMCPEHERVLLEVNDPSDEEIGTVSCDVCETLEIEPSEFKRADCRVMQFYRIRRYADGAQYASGANG